jgi:hypothetical protein
MIRILTSVEITKDNPEYLRFKYNDNSYQEYLITNDAPEACTTHMGDLDNPCISALIWLRTSAACSNLSSSAN